MAINFLYKEHDIADTKIISTPPNGEISATMVWLHDENGSQKIGEASPAGYTQEKRPRDRPGIRWSHYISDLVWSHLGVDPAELLEIAETVRYFESS